VNAESILIAVAIAALLALVVIRVIGPRTYDKYVLRDTNRTVPPRSSRVVALVILAVMIFLAVRFGSDLLRSASRQQLVRAPIIAKEPAGHPEAWVALLCVSATGLILSLFPLQVVTRPMGGRVFLSHTDEETTKKIRIFGRLVSMREAWGTLCVKAELRSIGEPPQISDDPKLVSL
jgi:hypothetical protein